MKTLNDYLNKKGITITEFAEMTGISMKHCYRFLHNNKYNINVNTAKKIYHSTKKKYGEGLGVWDYIEL
jgi:phage antirepressor YoqD-like protein